MLEFCQSGLASDLAEGFSAFDLRCYGGVSSVVNACHALCVIAFLAPREELEVGDSSKLTRDVTAEATVYRLTLQRPPFFKHIAGLLCFLGCPLTVCAKSSSCLWCSDIPVVIMEPLLVLHLGLNFGTKSSKFSTKVRILTSAGILLDRSKAGTSQASQQGRQHQREYRYVPRPFRSRMHKDAQGSSAKGKWKLEDGRRWKKMEEIQIAQSECFGMLRDFLLMAWSNVCSHNTSCSIKLKQAKRDQHVGVKRHKVIKVKGLAKPDVCIGSQSVADVGCIRPKPDVFRPIQRGSYRVTMTWLRQRFWVSQGSEFSLILCKRMQKVLSTCCVIVVSVKTHNTKAIIWNLLCENTWFVETACKRRVYCREVSIVSSLQCLHSLLQCNRTGLVVKFQTWHFGPKRKAALSKHRQPVRNLVPTCKNITALRIGLSQNQHAQPQLTCQSCCFFDLPYIYHVLGKITNWTNMTKNILLFKYRYTLCTPRIVTKSHTSKKLELYHHKQTYLIIKKNIIQTAHVSKMLFSFLCHACLAQAVSVATLDKWFKAPLDTNGY